MFNAKEFGLAFGTGYSLGQANQISGKTAFNAPYSLNFNAGAFYFPYRNLGVEANVPFYQTKGVSLSEVQAGLVLRLPLAKTVPVFRNFAPYVGVGGVYNWNSAKDFAYTAKVGGEVRLNKNWGVFIESQYRNTDFNFGQGQTTLNGGLHLVF